MRVYSIDEINPKYRGTVLKGLRELGLDNRPITDYELIFVAPMETLSDDFLVEEMK